MNTVVEGQGVAGTGMDQWRPDMPLAEQYQVLDQQLGIGQRLEGRVAWVRGRDLARMQTGPYRAQWPTFLDYLKSRGMPTSTAYQSINVFKAFSPFVPGVIKQEALDGVDLWRLDKAAQRLRAKLNGADPASPDAREQALFWFNLAANNLRPSFMAALQDLDGTGPKTGKQKRADTAGKIQHAAGKIQQGVEHDSADLVQAGVAGVKQALQELGCPYQGDPVVDGKDVPFIQVALPTDEPARGLFLAFYGAQQAVVQKINLGEWVGAMAMITAVDGDWVTAVKDLLGALRVGHG